MHRLACILGLILSFATPLFALGATIEPSSSDLIVTPGETAVATISVKNDANWLKNYEVTVVEARFGESAEDISFSALSATLKSAVSTTPRLFSLDAQTSRTIEVSIRLPEGTVAQSPTIAVLVTAKGDQSINGGTVQASIASVIFLRVPGTLERSYALDSFTAVPSFTFSAETMLSALFRNDGQETVIIPSDVRVFGPFGREVARGALTEDIKHLPPGTVRGVTLSWPAEPGFSRLLIGQYRFELWDGEQKVGETHATFVPVKLLLALGLGICVIILGIITSVRRRT